jgi:hypothetical protein
MGHFFKDKKQEFFKFERQSNKTLNIIGLAKE